jgi:hypothetical protein
LEGDVADYGIRPEGFAIKPLDVILEESAARARAIFGEDVDLTETSPLRKIIEVVAAEDGEIWKAQEDLYYAQFAATSSGDALDLIGMELGIARRRKPALGRVRLTIDGAVEGRRYGLPAGVPLVTNRPGQLFHTLRPVVLTKAAPAAEADAAGFEGLDGGNIPASAIVGVDAAYVECSLQFGAGVSLAATNPEPFKEGDKEEDETYRTRLIGVPRSLWTLESVRRAAADVAGVTDVLLSDPLGGVDVTQSVFNEFAFTERPFSSERRFGELYFFDVVVAHEPHWPWRTLGQVPGIQDRVREAIDRVRPVGIFPNIVQADHIEVAVKARVVIEPGYNPDVVLASTRQRLLGDIGALKLGGDLLYSQVMRAVVEQPGVVDVQNLRLRRCPPGFGRISFGRVQHQAELIEAGPGENLTLGPTEIAVFALDGELNDLEVVRR